MGEENIKFSEGTMFAEINGERVEIGPIKELTVVDVGFYGTDPAPVRISTGETAEVEIEIPADLKEEILCKLTGELNQLFNPPFEDRIKLHKRVSRKRYIKLLMSHGLSRNEAEFSAFLVRSLGHPYYTTLQYTMF